MTLIETVLFVSYLVIALAYLLSIVCALSIFTLGEAANKNNPMYKIWCKCKLKGYTNGVSLLVIFAAVTVAPITVIVMHILPFIDWCKEK